MVWIVLLVTAGLAGFFDVPAASGRPLNSTALNVGFTFSEQQANYLDLSWQQAYESAMALSPSVVRLGAYWNAIEPSPGVYDFSSLDWMLDHTPETSAVVLTVGMKAPRWPEYYLPDWMLPGLSVPNGGDPAGNPEVRQAALQFVGQVVKHELHRPNVKYWQIENEPLDPGGPHKWALDPAFVRQEAALIRSIDPSRLLVANMFVETSPLGALPSHWDAASKRAADLLQVADVIGLDVYPTMPVITKRVQFSLSWPAWVWEPRVLNLRRLAQSHGKQIWISEAQAEPWLPAQIVYDGPTPPPYTSPSLTRSTVDRLRGDGFQTILLWGVEYWYARDQRYQDGAWWQHMLPFFQHSASNSGT